MAQPGAGVEGGGDGIGDPQVDDRFGRECGGFACQRNAALHEVFIARASGHQVALNLPLGRGAQAHRQLDALGRLLAHQKGQTGIVRVLRGDVFAVDLEGGQGGRALAIPEVELAAHLDLAPGGEFAVVAHIPEGGGGERSGRGITSGGELGIQVGIGCNVPDHANAPRGGVIGAAESGRVGGRHCAAVGQVQLNAFVPQGGDEVDFGRYGRPVLQVQRCGACLVVAVRVEAGLHAGNVEEVFGREVVRVDRAHGGG